MKALYVQPILTSYRKPLTQEISKFYELVVLCGKPESNSGFKPSELSDIKVIECQQKNLLGGRLLFQNNVLRSILQQKPDIILTCANMRDITYWLLLLVCKSQGIKVFSHGQGLYSKRKINIFNKLLYRSAIQLSYKYICYTPLSRETLISAGCTPEKLVVADNSIKFSADALKHTKLGDENGILFVGRLREQCGLEELITAATCVRKTNEKLTLHIIGTGELEKKYRELYAESWVVFHGAIYDDSKILEISKSCRVGCYPGNAGLSIVHYFSLRLPPIVHDDIFSHMGPEPSYIENGINGIAFCKERGSSGIIEAIERIWSLTPSQYMKLSDAAFAKYQTLNNPTMETKILNILNSHTPKDEQL